MRGRSRRRRAALFLSLSLAAGGLAASQVHGHVEEVEARTGPMVPVVVAKEDVGPGTKLDEQGIERLLSVRRVPERFVPRDSFGDPQETLGLRTASPVAAGSYLTGGHVREGTGSEDGGPALGRGERAVEVAVAGGEDVGALGGPGARVDVLVTSEPRSGPGRTYVALENVDLLSARPGAEVDDSPSGTSGGGRAGILATLRVSMRQAVFLTAAENFAREVRLLPRPPGDKRRVGRALIDGADL